MMGLSINFKEALKSGSSIVENVSNSEKYNFTVTTSGDSQTFQFVKYLGSLHYKLTTSGITQGPFTLSKSSSALSKSGASLAPYAGHSFVVKNDLITLQVDEKGSIRGATLKTNADLTKLGGSILGETDHYQVYMNSGAIGALAETPFVVEKNVGNILVLSRSLDEDRKRITTITLTHGSYLIDIQDRITAGVGLKMFRQIVEISPDRSVDTSHEHIGPIGLINNNLTEIDYDSLDSRGTIRASSTGGWIGIANRQFIAAIIANPDRNTLFYFKGNGQVYQAGLIDDDMTEGNDAVFHSTVFIGPKSKMPFSIGR